MLYIILIGRKTERLGLIMAILPLSPPNHSSLSPPPPPPSLPAPSSDPPLFALGTFTVDMELSKVSPSRTVSLVWLLNLFHPYISTTSETLVGGINPLSFVIGCAEVTLARVNLPPFTCCIKSGCLFSKLFSPDLSIQ